MTKIVALGDAHAHPDFDNKRFSIIGEFVAQELCTAEDGYFVQVGDWGDCSAFNMHGSKLEMAPRRWKDDKACVQDSLRRFKAPILRRKRRTFQMHIVLGNHEARADIYAAQHPELHGTIGSHELGFEEHGFQVTPYRRVLNIEGVNFTHCLFGQSPKPIKVNSPSPFGFIKRGQSYCVGHSHVASHTMHSFEDRTIHGIDLGCAIHPNMGYQENWSCQTAHKYDRGIWVFDNVENGDFDFRFVRLDSLGC